MPLVRSPAILVCCPNVKFLAWPYFFLSEEIRRLAGLVNTIARFDGDNGGDDGSNVSVSPDAFVIHVSAAREKDCAGGWEAPVPLPRDADKIVFVPSTCVSVLGELT